MTTPASACPVLRAAVGLAVALASAQAFAEEGESGAPDDVTGLHVASSLAFRAAPLGLVLTTDGGYRMSLSDSDALLLDGTYVEPGAAVQLTPSSAKGGVYLEGLPLAVLQLRASAQAMSYLGAWGYLHLPADPTDDAGWSLGELGGGPTDGASGSGVMLEAMATPRALVGRTVFLAETRLRWTRVSVDQAYYEPAFDMLLEPTDSHWITQPTLGQVFVLPDRNSWILAALRWEHGRTSRSGVVRDMAAAVGLWKLPWSVRGGEAVLAVVGGYWVRHPNRAGTVYAATQLSVDWQGL